MTNCKKNTLERDGRVPNVAWKKNPTSHEIQSTPLPNVCLDININCIFPYNTIDHKWVHYLFGNNEPCFKKTIPSIIMTVKPIKLSKLLLTPYFWRIFKFAYWARLRTFFTTAAQNESKNTHLLYAWYGPIVCQLKLSYQIKRVAPRPELAVNQYISV